MSGRLNHISGKILFYSPAGKYLNAKILTGRNLIGNEQLLFIHLFIHFFIFLFVLVRANHAAALVTLILTDVNEAH